MTTTTAPRSMIAKYPGRCITCGAQIRRGSRINYHGRGIGASCFDCLSTEPHVIITRFSSGFESYRNSRGRCEDAPCCGCCT